MALLSQEMLERLTDLVRAETAALRANRTVDLKANADIKAHALVELTRVQSVPGWQTDLSAAEHARLDALRAALTENVKALDTHRSAADYLAEVLAASLRARESDGTYGRSGRAGQA